MQWLLYILPDLALKHSQICLHSVFVGFVQFSQQMVIISMKNISRFIPSIEMQCVLYEVRTEFHINVKRLCTFYLLRLGAPPMKLDVIIPAYEAV
jgi:hypothetical protein